MVFIVKQMTKTESIGSYTSEFERNFNARAIVHICLSYGNMFYLGYKDIQTHYKINAKKSD